MIDVTGRSEAIDIKLGRHRLGVRVYVRVLGEVEEFFRHWGADISEPPAYGRLWRPLPNTPDGPDRELRVWNFEGGRSGVDGESRRYSLVHTGAGFYTDGGNVNLSLIRLVGASEGRSFIVEAVHSTEELDKIAQRLAVAGEQFYSGYIQPKNVRVFVGVHNLPPTPSG